VTKQQQNLMSTPTLLYRQLFGFLSQYSEYRDLRHIKSLGWMVTALIGTQQLSPPAWESYVPSQAQKAQSYERRWQHFMNNRRINVMALYVPLILGVSADGQRDDYTWEWTPLFYGIATA
jgi:hypothetical protein